MRKRFGPGVCGKLKSQVVQDGVLSWAIFFYNNRPTDIEEYRSGHEENISQSLKTISLVKKDRRG